MGSSRASTSAGRQRAAQRAAARKGSSRSRAATKRPAAKASSSRRPKAATRRPAKPRAAGPTRKRPAPARRRKAPAKTPPATSRRPGFRGLLRRVVQPATLLAALAVALCLAGAYWFWFRDSSFVAVERVTVEGVSGPGSDEVSAALKEAAGSMTTLHVRDDELEQAVAGFPTVVSVSADADFPRGLAIRVVDRPPAMLAATEGRELPVAGDGTVLAGLDVGDTPLPRVEVAKLPSQGALQGEDLELARVAGAAPAPLLELIRDLRFDSSEGVEATLEGDVPIYFGTGERAPEKWAAVAAILADPQVDTLTYLDVRVPERPALGGAAPPPEQTTPDAGVVSEAAVP